jgi:hypothetical protein
MPPLAAVADPACSRYHAKRVRLLNGNELR